MIDNGVKIPIGIVKYFSLNPLERDPTDKYEQNTDHKAVEYKDVIRLFSRFKQPGSGIDDQCNEKIQQIRKHLYRPHSGKPV